MGESIPRDILKERADIDAAVDGQTVCDLFSRAVVEHGDRSALRWKEGESWRSLSWAEYAERADALAAGLASLGFEAGEFANLIGANRPEYYVCDVAIMKCGGRSVSLYNTLAPEQLEYIVNHCEASIVFVENAQYLQRFLALRDRIPGVRKIVVMESGDAPEADEWVVGYDALMAAGREWAAAHPDAIVSRAAALSPDDLCTLIYTSGTTGPPKGVMLTHRNILWTCESSSRMRPVVPGQRQISYLPLAHIAERMTGHYMAMRTPSEVWFCPDPRQIAAYLPEVRPEYFFAVPRIWEKIHDKLLATLEAEPDPNMKATAQRALEAAIEGVRCAQAGRPVPDAVTDQQPVIDLVAGTIRQRLGFDDLRIASTGAAPIARTVLEFFHAVGVPIAEVYGQSEDCGPTSWNRLEHIKIGTVGPSIPGVEVKTAEDGELLVRGGNVSPGYYKEPEQSAATFDAEGWLHSGDVVEIDEEGFIKIVDRKKEILITAGGKNVAPSNVEALLKQHPLIGQACLVGDARPYCSALIVLDPEVTPAWASEGGLPQDLARLAEHEAVRAELQAHVDEINGRLHNQEQVKTFRVLPREWTVESGELTPTMKMKRRVVTERYSAEIESMYG